jgi:hypothetical protein
VGDALPNASRYSRRWFDGIVQIDLWPPVSDNGSGNTEIEMFSATVMAGSVSKA